MAIKSKNMIKLELILVLAWVLSSMVLTCLKIYYSYWVFFKNRGYSYGWSVPLYQKLVLIMLVCLIILMVPTVIGTIWTIEKVYALPEKREFFFDRIMPELLAVPVLWCGWRWKEAFFVRKLMVWKRYEMYDLNEIVHVIWILFWLLLAIYVSFWLIIRQMIRGRLTKNSLVMGVRRRYLQMTPTQKRLQHRGRLLAVVYLAACAGMLGYGYYKKWFQYANLNKSALVIGGILCTGSVLLLIGTGFLNKIGRETGCLVEKIRATAEGEQPDEKYRLSGRALLYESFQQLENIDTAMQKGIEKQMKAERLKVDLITNVSHDLKTPLTSMIGYTDLLKKEELSPEARDYVDVISVKQEQLKEMIQDLFELSKATSGVGNLKLETLDMRKLLEQTLGDMEDRIKESGREIRTHFEGEPLLFTGDNEKMYRVVQNLLENALKYSLEDTRIYLSAERQEDQVRMEIKNISSYEMDFAADEIMERFVRGDKARSTEGHGLGLAIASSFVKNMGGDLQLAVDGDLFKAMMTFSLNQETQ